MITVSVVGATGYTGGELLRILCKHPEFKVKIATSRSDAGQPLANIWPALAGHLDVTVSTSDIDNLAKTDLVFFATPNLTAMQQVPELLKHGCKVIDLSADFRFKSADEWSAWYGAEHACPELLNEAVYGLPELYREQIKTASLVANPGCYPTAINLGLLPLLEQGLIDPSSIIADAKSGVSGAGRGLSRSKLYGEVGENFKAYGITGHRHHPEILQTLNQVAHTPIALTFVPHLLPMFRGMQATLYANLIEEGFDVQEIFAERYRDHPFVEVLAPDVCPGTADVQGSNQCRISFHLDEENRRIIVLSVIDNLVKGAAGQAVQNANLMCGLKESAGLDTVALFP